MLITFLIFKVIYSQKSALFPLSYTIVYNLAAFIHINVLLFSFIGYFAFGAILFEYLFIRQRINYTNGNDIWQICLSIFIITCLVMYHYWIFKYVLFSTEFGIRSLWIFLIEVISFLVSCCLMKIGTYNNKTRIEN